MFSSLESSLVVYSMSQEDLEMIRLLTRRLIMYIGVQGTVESLLGAIFETYLRQVNLTFYLLYSHLCKFHRNGFVNGSEKKTNIRNIFSEDVITIILEYYKEV